MELWIFKEVVWFALINDKTLQLILSFALSFSFAFIDDVILVFDDLVYLLVGVKNADIEEVNLLQDISVDIKVIIFCITKFNYNLGQTSPGAFEILLGKQFDL